MGTLRSNEIFSGPRHKVIAVESVDVVHSRTNTGCRMYGRIEPIAVIVSGPGGTYAVDMEATLTDLDQLKQSIPELGILDQ